MPENSSTMNESINGTEAATATSVLQPEYLQIALYCLAIILSLIGNTLVIAIVHNNANKQMKTPSNLFVVSMAVGDGLITLINMVAQVTALRRGSSVLLSGIAGQNEACMIQNWLWMFLIFWSTGSLTAIAVDRFLLVFLPLKRIITLKVARVIILTILIIGAVISWPLFMFSTPLEYEGMTFCFVTMSNFAFRQFYYVFLFVAFIFFPLFVLLILYTAIGVRMCLRKSPGNAEVRERMNRRLVLMLVTIVVLFACCWLPVSSLYFGCFAFPDSGSCVVLGNKDKQFTLWFVAYSDSAINPYVYFIFNEGFRHGARHIWSSLRGRVLGLLNRHHQVGAFAAELSTRTNGRGDQ